MDGQTLKHEGLIMTLQMHGWIVALIKGYN